MDNHSIRWGILGTSYISTVMARAIRESKTSQLVAIGSRSLDKATAFSSQFSIPKTYHDYQLMLNDPEIDAIYLGLPNHLHQEWIFRCAEAGKNILCEKPFVISIEGAADIVSVLGKTDVICMEALMYRYHPFTKKLQEIIENKIIGDVKLYNATYTANIASIANPTSGGSIRNLGCYPVSLVRLLAKAEPIEIRGTGRLSSINSTDNQASVILKFADDSIAVISTADDIDMYWQFDIYGTKGLLKVITNPWLPSENNKISIQLNGESNAKEIIIAADQSLYTYQIDTLNKQIMNKKNGQFEGITLLDSLGNTIVLETWLNQLKNLT